MTPPCTILTDSVEAAETFFDRALRPLPGQPEQTCSADLTGPIFGSRPVHAVEAPAVDFPPRFRLLVLQEWAARSNIETLSDLQRGGVAIPDGLVCAAVSGERFVGRFDRSWECAGGNLHAVIRLEPALTMEQAGPAFSILAAVACVEAIGRILPIPRIKWINDVFLEGQKVAGVLTRQTFQEPHITDVLLGVGINVQAVPDVNPDRFVPAAGSLASLAPGSAPSPGLVLAELLISIDRWYGDLLARGPRSLLDAYRSHSSVLNRRVRIYADGYRCGDSGDEPGRLVARGRVTEILDDLSLRLDGVSTPIASGRLAFEADCNSPDSPCQ